MVTAPGFGVFQIPAEETVQAVADAIEAGYRHIDTAQSYANEEAVGEGIRRSGLDRSELFVTTKVWLDNYGRGTTFSSVEASLERLGLDYVDEFLLHQPFSDVFGAWHDLEEAHRQGLARRIGVSNFTPARVHDLGSFSDIYPMVNQIEINPFHQRTADVVELQEKGVAVEAWAPFAEGKSGLFTNPVLTEIGEAYGKSPAQVTLRWLLQRGITPLAKSVRPERMSQNLDVQDFELTAQDMEAISTLESGNSLFFDHQSLAAIDLMVSLVKQRRQ
ncbi:2,5-diketo-D-gluconic acid reductase [Rothia nasimurium]|uniref:2,5-diketo-D-gluconic acid reductase n=1 Tax=Rothia nasimurium TaxID=85336 RepID=A0A1Y1RRB2_9MICC|nr:aldo/keto reductase [Rothia nasimurium]ORC20651.1 2,5-diketo-D-gluconic acid reductase [Rothia nasimurium]